LHTKSSTINERYIIKVSGVVFAYGKCPLFHSLPYKENEIKDEAAIFPSLSSMLCAHIFSLTGKHKMNGLKFFGSYWDD
jgi:hypothetical protein